MAYPFKFKAKADEAPKGKSSSAGIVPGSPRAKMLKARGKKKKKKMAKMPKGKGMPMMEMDA